MEAGMFGDLDFSKVLLWGGVAAVLGLGVRWWMKRRAAAGGGATLRETPRAKKANRRRNARAKPVTDAQIRALLAEARSAGDMAMVGICKRALGDARGGAKSAPARRVCVREIRRAQRRLW
jgi:hypothetical protein